MTVEELISRWTEDERNHHADLIAECMEREQDLNRLRNRMKDAEQDLTRSLDDLFCTLAELSRDVEKSAEQLGRLELRLTKPKAYA
jgi:hypothetical protein